jgi:hypothetical protein
MYDPDQYTLFCWFHLLEHSPTTEDTPESREINRVCSAYLSEPSPPVSELARGEAAAAPIQQPTSIGR